jgi:hypothetical protein
LALFPLDEKVIVFKSSITALTLALVATPLMLSTAVATKPPTGLTYTTTTTVFDTSTTATVTGLLFEANQFSETCAVFDVTVHGSFQYWTGSEFVTMTQEPTPQRADNCQGTGALRQDLVTFYLNPAAGTFDMARFTSLAPANFRGSDGSTYIGHAPLAPLTLTATTHAQRKAICDLQTKATRLSDKRLVTELNNLLALFSATQS